MMYLEKGKKKKVWIVIDKGLIYAWIDDNLSLLPI